MIRLHAHGDALLRRKALRMRARPDRARSRSRDRGTAPAIAPPARETSGGDCRFVASRRCVRTGRGRVMSRHDGVEPGTAGGQGKRAGARRSPSESPARRAAPGKRPAPERSSSLRRPSMPRTIMARIRQGGPPHPVGPRARGKPPRTRARRPAPAAVRAPVQRDSPGRQKQRVHQDAGLARRNPARATAARWNIADCGV